MFSASILNFLFCEQKSRDARVVRCAQNWESLGSRSGSKPWKKTPGADGALELTEVPWEYKPLLPMPQHGSTCIHALSVQQEKQICALDFADGRI